PAMPRRLVLSGPSDTPQTAPTARPVQQAPVQRTERDAVSAAMGGAARVGDGAPQQNVAALRTNRGEERTQKPVTVDEKVGRNDPCPCGSGKKYKKCHGVGVA